MQKVILFYKFTPIADPQAEVMAQLAIAKELNLTGRVLLAIDGVNGTLAGEEASIDAYIEYCNNHGELGGIDFKIAPANEKVFPNLQIRKRPEIVTLGVPGVTLKCERAKHVDRDTFHQWLVDGVPMCIIDMRNDYEWEIGRFIDSVKPPMKYFRDLKEQAEFYKKLIGDARTEGKKIVMFCTGGIRCEVASAFLDHCDIELDAVYQLEGGIIKYGEKYGDDGYFEGKCFVFDERLAVPIDTSDAAKVVGNCLLCNSVSDIYRNCANRFCNKLFIACDDCAVKYENTCGDECREIIKDPTAMRPPHGNDVRPLHRNK